MAGLRAHQHLSYCLNLQLSTEHLGILAGRESFNMTADSVFASAPRIPKDAIFALTAQYKEDVSPVKVNLGQGAYRDNEAMPWVLPSVAQARRKVHDRKLDHEYLPILGLPEFRKAASRLVLGSQSYASISSRVCRDSLQVGTVANAGRLQVAKVCPGPVVFTLLAH